MLLFSYLKHMATTLVKTNQLLTFSSHLNATLLKGPIIKSRIFFLKCNFTLLKSVGHTYQQEKGKTCLSPKQFSPQ